MKITDVKLRFAKHYLFVQVYTDAVSWAWAKRATGAICRRPQQQLKHLPTISLEKTPSEFRISIKIF